MNQPVVLVILDGFGLAPEGPGNAVALAHTPVFDRLWAERPRTELAASGPAVGLPAGQMGNSEVGHMNLGAGRVIRQSLTYIQAQIDEGTFFANPVLTDLYASVAPGGTLHLLGLVSAGGVHSDLAHLLALLDLAERRGVQRVRVHAFTDGRDAPPDSGAGYVRRVESRLAELRAHGLDARFASVSGRYYAMDRDRRWERTQQAFDAVVCGQAAHTATSAEQAVAAAYARGETDEFVVPTVITDEGGAPVGTVADGDALFFFNFRADRARQLTYALLGGPEWREFERCASPRVCFASMMEYDREWPAPFAFALPEVTDTLPEVLAAAGLRQYHAAETEKYAHVTYFFNAQREVAYPGEDRALVPSPKVPTYDLKPEMSSEELTELTVKRILEEDDAFVLINYANPDMVGHTGVLEAAVKACEAVDRGLGRLLEATLARGGTLLVIADHGNAEQMLEPDGSPHTAHTINPVPCVLVSDAAELQGVKLRSGGALADVAPTVLDLLGLPQPAAMTGRTLLER